MPVTNSWYQAKNHDMNFDLQPKLENDIAILYPLQETDFDALYAVASNPKIWEQHPTNDRWKEEVFRNFFDGAIQSKGAFKVIDKSSGNVAGCTRIYDFDAQENSIMIGYTFYGTEYWGKGINHSVKTLLLDYLFQFVSYVNFQVGAINIRSQIAISRLGAKKIGEQEVAYFGETPKLNYLYRIEKEEWLANRTGIPEATR
jgi:N-acetyltransferase